MKTYIVKSINQNGDNYYYYPKGKNVMDALDKGSKENLRINNDFNTWQVLEAELFDIKKHSRH